MIGIGKISFVLGALLSNSVCLKYGCALETSVHIQFLRHLFMTGIIKAVLGPTNTGKTHYAVERMLAYSSGVMGFPLRLLAREVYDRVVAVKGKNQVALLTGEERIMPDSARYFMCTAEAMPRHSAVDFVAIDEIQMAADPGRGHIFTEHLLHTRGRHETLFLGAAAMRGLIVQLVPDVEVVYRERFSSLSHVRPAKISQLPRRSAVVAFSAGDVYGMAELLKRQKGGAAIVMGALSPRTRNAQVAMYQSGEVDYLVATDAIGMGLNLDLGHVAFAGLTKFDGQNYRYLRAAEAAQVAGRAGRYKTDGSFSTLGGGGNEAMDPAMIAQIEEHRFEPVKTIYWRSQKLNFSTIPRLLQSLEQPALTDGLSRSRNSVDLLALKALAADGEISALAVHPEAVTRLWNICQIPDFRKLSPEDHYGMLRRIFVDLMGPSGTIPHDWIARQVKRLDNMDGDIDTLAGRIASIRTWTYVSHRKGWLQDAAHWAHVTRSIEDKLSDALHEKLTQRFVDKRTAVLMRSLRQRDALSVSIDSETNKVSVEGHEIGELNGFSFRVDADSSGDEQKLLKAAAEAGLQMELTRRAKIFANVGYKKLAFDFEQGLNKPILVWEGAPVATVHDSGALFGPRVKLVASTLLADENADLVREKIQQWLDERISERMDPLVKLAQELNGEIEPPEGAVPLAGLVRGVAFRLIEHYGVMARGEIDGDLRQLDQDARKGLRRFGIRIGASSLYMPFVMKPHATELRLAMWAMAGGKEGLPKIPTPGMVWVAIEEGAPNEFYELAGFLPCGKKAVRMDMLERLSDAVRPLGQNTGWFEVTPEIMGLVGLSGEDFANVMKASGYKHELREVAPVLPEVEAESTAEIPVDASVRVGIDSPIEDAAEVAVAELNLAVVDVDAEKAAEARTETLTETPTETPAEISAETPVEVQAETPVAVVLDAAADTISEPTTVLAGTPGTVVAQTDSEIPACPESAPAEVALVERYYFTWAPKRKARAQQHPRKKTQPAAARPGGGARDGKNADADRRGSKNNSNTRRGKSKPPQRAQQAKPAPRPQRYEKKADPDSPFAALAGLKEALSKKK